MEQFTPYLNWIDTQKKTLLDRVKKWSSINTYTYNVEGLSQLLEILERDYEALKGVAARTKLPAHKILMDGSSFHGQPLGEALILRKRPKAPLQILLGGHYDTVFAPSAPFQHVEEYQKDLWNGPGIADMKGGLAILLTAVEALERSPWAQQVGWEILLTPDEEIGSPGSTPLYLEAAKRNHIGLLFEPSFPDGTFVSERKGSVTFTVVVHGKAAHVGRDFPQGRSAVFALARFIHQLDLSPRENDCTINVTDIEGKGPVNIVPPFASCKVNIRSMRAEILSDSCKKLKQIALESQCEGIQIEVVQDSYRPPKPFDPLTKKLFEAYGSCASALELPFSYRSTGGVCDGNILAGAGLPTFDTAGAVGGSLHTFDEYLVVPSLIERSKLAALFLFKWANGEIVLKKETANG